MRIGIATPWLVPNADAIGIDVLAMRGELEALGHEVRCFAISRQPDADAAPMAEAPAFLAAGDLMIYHHSTAWDEGLEVLARLACRRVLRYHNVTPPEFFAGVEDSYREASQRGLEQTRALAAIAHELVLCDSAYNRAELLAAGFAGERCVVLPPFNHLDRLQRQPLDAGFAQARADGRFTVLNVGRLAPNKDHATLLRAFARFAADTQRHARLLVVGLAHANFFRYLDSLRAVVRSLGIEERVEFTGVVDEAQLRTAYAIADLFVISSRHEGFSVPVVEAMWAKVPVVACASAALPETLGGCGLLAPPGDDAAMAAAMARLANDGAAASALTLAGLRRAHAHYTRPAIARGFAAAMAPLLR